MACTGLSWQASESWLIPCSNLEGILEVWILKAIFCNVMYLVCITDQDTFTYPNLCGMCKSSAPEILSWYRGGGGYLVQKTLRGCAATMGSKISLLVYEWPLIKCKIWYMNGSIFQNLANLSLFLKKILEKIRNLFGTKLGRLKKLVFVNSVAAHPYQNQTWVPPPGYLRRISAPPAKDSRSSFASGQLSCLLRSGLRFALVRINGWWVL